MLAVAFPASGVDLKALFRFLGKARRHPVRVVILPIFKGLALHRVNHTRDRLSTELATLGVGGFTVEKLQLYGW